MHVAYESSQLLKLTVQIESLAAYDDNLLVGTKQGHLLMYSVAARNGDQKHDVQLMRYNKNFSKKPIQQLEVIPDYQLLVSLSDNVITVHDMSMINFPAITTIQKTRGATLFTLDIKKHTSLTGETSVTVRMCVAVKRKLQLFYWKNGGFLELREDLTVSDVPKALTWCQETLVVGFKGDYILLELSGKKIDLFPTDKHPEPCITKLSENTFALGKDTRSLFMDTKGDLIHTYGLKWSEVPVALAYDDPYLIALLSESLEVRCIEPNLYIQAMPMSKARLITRCQQGLVYVASISHVWCLQAVPLSRQIQIVLKEKHFQLALKLTNISDETEDEKSKNISQIQTHYAYDLFYNKQFLESMKEFLKLGTEVYEVIRLFPDLLPQQSKSEQESPVVNSMKLQDRDLEKGLLALIEFLTEVRHKSMGDTKNANNTNQINMNHKSSQQLLQIIDTTLLKCYLQTNDALIAPLLRLNHCHLAESEKTLKKHQKYSELIILYQTKGHHKKALELLQKQGQQPDSTLYGYERTLQYLQHLGKEHIDLIFQFASWVLELNPDEGLKIFTEDVQEVENLPRPKVLDFLLRTHKEQVIPYLEHVIDFWDDGNQIFHSALVHQYRERCQQLMAETATSADREAGELTRIKLLAFLEKSTHYTPETVLIHFPYDCLFEERAIILGKLGRHEQALSIYVSVLGDVPRAIKYCDKVYTQKSEGFDEVYVILMKMLISPPDNWLASSTQSPVTAQPDLETALSLLAAYAPRIHPVKALMVLPDKVPLVRIKHFLEASLQQKLNERRKTQVLKGLLYAEHLQVQEMRMNYQSQNIVMTEFNVCPVCKKRFGNQSAFARYPNGDIIHYSCQDKRA